LCPIAPLGLVIACYWIPESPRWLIWNDRLDEAWVVIQRVHHDPSNPTDTAAHAEFIQIKAQVEHDKQFKATYLQMFTHPSWRRRTILAILVIFAVGSAGINGITTYLILVAQSIGFTGSKALLLYGIYVIIAVGFNFVNAAVIDKVGRRPLLRKCRSCR
jgi:GNAT superfamily N-acetyltransferase